MLIIAGASLFQNEKEQHNTTTNMFYYSWTPYNIWVKNIAFFINIFYFHQNIVRKNCFIVLCIVICNI